MKWNWQQPDWPAFVWRDARLAKAEAAFAHGGGVLVGMTRHLEASDQTLLTVESMSDEALTTSEIEGDILNRDSVQSSIRRQLGLAADARRVSPAEQGVSEMMVDLHRGFAAALGHETLFAWHAMVFKGRTDLRDIARYRTHAEPMQVVSGRLYEPTVHFEAPASADVPAEMTRLIDWFNRTAPGGPEPLPTLARAGTAHLYFESVHPFEDGNGRLGRALAEKALAQGLGRPSYAALAATILARRRGYYDALEAANKHNEVTAWLAWFAGVAIEAQRRTIAQVEFLIDKTRYLDGLRNRLLPRQHAVLLRVLREGPEGFKGGLSAGKYTAIAKVSAATATRDLADLVEKSALRRTGERKAARYHLPIPLRPVARVEIDAAGNIVGVPREP